MELIMLYITPTQEVATAPRLDKEIWIKTADTLYELKKQIKELRKQEKELTEQLKTLSGHKSIVCGPFQFNMSLRKGPVQYAQIPELQHVDLDQYRTADVEQWKLELYR